MTKNNNNNGVFTTLLVVFVVLKVAGLIQWSWLWVLSPVWIPICLLMTIFFGAIFIKFIEILLSKYHK